MMKMRKSEVIKTQPEVTVQCHFHHSLLVQAAHNSFQNQEEGKMTLHMDDVILSGKITLQMST